MARFVEEIIEGKLIVSRKKKVVLVEELRDRKYEAFPRGESVKKARNTDEEMDQDDDEDNEDLTSNEPGAGDYDYLLSVREPYSLLETSALTLYRCPSTP